MKGHLHGGSLEVPRNLGNENSINGLVRSRTAMIKSQTGRKNVWFNSVYEQLKFN